MGKPSKVPQLYGYSVCLVAVITFLVSTSGVVVAAFDLSNPMRAQRPYSGVDVPASFELYQAEYREGQSRERASAPEAVEAVEGSRIVTTTRAPRSAQPEALSDAALRKLYDAKVAERTAGVRFQAVRSLVGSGLMLLLSVALFAAHWLWLRRLSRLDLAISADPTLG